MSLDAIELWVRLLGGAAMLAPLAAVLWGLWRSLNHPIRPATDIVPKVFRSAPFYLAASVLYFGFCAAIWRPLPLTLSAEMRIVGLVLGALLYFPGLAFILWGRLTLGRLYNVSTSLGAPLYADHRLITHGPFAIVRHPMYLGICVAAFGGLMIYRTWTLVFLAVTFLGLTVRARREEQALASEFGEEWKAYCRRVPAWIPRMR